MSKIKYRDLTDIQKKFICNGCGGKGGFINPPEFLFHADCNRHDFNYFLGYRFIDKLKADWQFYKAMLEDCLQAKTFFKYLLYAFLATVYYIAVSIFGVFFFNFSDHEVTKEELEDMIEFDKNKK